MNTFAAVMTGQGIGAISTIQLFGNNAQTILKKLFKPAGQKQTTLEQGKILLGTINEDTETIDQVTLSCEAPNNFAIHCHGNPLIVSDIMKLLGRNGIKLLSYEKLLAKMLVAKEDINTVAIEAKLAIPNAKTLLGTKIIANQIDAGLCEKANQWLNYINQTSLNDIKNQAKQILQASQTARLIIQGCKIAILGPPNSGKSTLLNYLAGKQKAIVTDIPGTTRDYVSAHCQIGSLLADLIDTAGLDETLAKKQTLQKQSQQETFRVLKQADLLLLVLDNNRPLEHLEKKILHKIKIKKVLTVLNKSDLPARLDPDRLPPHLRQTVLVSAKFGTGIENLIKEIQQILAVSDFDLKTPICFTNRQKHLLEKLTTTTTTARAVSIITELLNARLRV